MGHYIDCETTNLSPSDGTITTIQFQKLNFDASATTGPLIILKAWESSEKEILKQFSEIFNSGGKWDFAPCYGFNLFFEERFLRERCIANGLPPIKLFSKPSVDLHPVSIFFNGGKFKGSGLDKISGKEGNGLKCLGYYEAGEYNKVEEYIKQEAAEFIKLVVWLTKNMPRVLNEFRESLI